MREAVRKVVEESIPLLFSLGSELDVNIARFQAAEQLAELAADDDLTEGEVLLVFAALSRQMETAGRWVHHGMQDLVELTLHDLVNDGRVRLSLLGTAWRFTVFVSAGLGHTMRSLMEAGCLENPNAPVEVLAYGKSLCGHIFDAPALLGRIQETYPDTVGLPAELAYQVAASQEIPAGWFVDAFPLPAGVQLVAPGVVRDGHN